MSVVLITGINGFVGKNLKIHLLKEGHTVYGVDLTGDGKSTFSCDLRHKPSLVNVVKKTKPAYVFHLAASFNRDMRLLRDSLEVNLLGTMNLIDSLAETNLRQFITLDTSEIYSGKVPFKEDGSVSPRSPYSLSKYQTTLMLQLLHSIDNFPASILRPSTVFGPHQSGGMFIPSLIKSVINDKKFQMTKGVQTRDFIFVEDLIRGILKTMDNRTSIGEVINLGSGNEVSLKEVTRQVLDLTGKPEVLIKTSLPYRPEEQMRYVLDIRKAKKILNWTPKTSLEAGLRKTIEWFKKQEDAQ